MSSSEDKDVGAYTWITVSLNGAASNLAVMIRELIGLYQGGESGFGFFWIRNPRWIFFGFSGFS